MSIDGYTALQADTSDFITVSIQALRSIVEQTGAQIVMSSEWRRSEELKNAVDEILVQQQMPACVDVTTTAMERRLGMSDPVTSFAERRAREIGNWLKDHPNVRMWVVIDDINLAVADNAAERDAKTPRMAGHLVQTLPHVGLTMENAKAAVRILRGEMVLKVIAKKETKEGEKDGAALVAMPPLLRALRAGATPGQATQGSVAEKSGAATVIPK